MHVPSLVSSSAATQKQSDMHAAWQSAALVPAASTPHGVSAHDTFCMVAMDEPGSALCPAVHSPAPELAVHPPAASPASIKSNPGGHKQLGSASRSSTQ